MSFRASLRSIWNCLFSTNHSIYRLFMQLELRILVLNFMFNLLNVSKGKNILCRTKCWKHEDKYPFMHLLDMLPLFAERRIKLLCPFQITFLFSSSFLALFLPLRVWWMWRSLLFFYYQVGYCGEFQCISKVLFRLGNLYRKLRRGKMREKKLDRRFLCATFSWLDFVCCGLI